MTKCEKCELETHNPVLLGYDALTAPNEPIHNFCSRKHLLEWTRDNNSYDIEELEWFENELEKLK